MKVNLNTIAAACALSMVLLTGCSNEEKTEGFVDETANIDNGVTTEPFGENTLSGSDLGGGGTGGGDSFGGESLNADQSGYGDFSGAAGTGGPHGTKIIYFMLDSSQVMEEFVPVIAEHAKSLKANPSQHVIIEGHTDERGSREYNVALGEQRAKTVAKMLVMQGVPESQVETVSYGEEKPVDAGHNESAWQVNRRAEIDYQGQ